MYYLNKIVWFFLNPLVAPLLAAAAGLAFAFRGRRRRYRLGGFAVALLALTVLYFAATPLAVRLLGVPLERPYLKTQAVETLPVADAIVLLGGGVGYAGEFAYPELFEAADRVWHAARLYRAGKAPRVVVSGSNDLKAAVPLLVDLGVPREAMVVDNRSRNTYENSRFTERLLSEGRDAALPPPTVLVVTSAWHMPRALGNFSRTSLKVTPAATDFKASYVIAGCRHWWDYLLPSADTLAAVNYLAKEWVGRLARK